MRPMSFEDPTGAPDHAEEAPDDDSPQGVFGNLPHSRPGARSPRRDATRARAAERGGRSTARAAPEQKGPPGAAAQQTDPLSDAARALRDSEPQREGAGPDAPEPDMHGGGGLEDVAWAGVAAAAEAATIGVRLATRALEAMRDAVDRR